MQLEKSQSPEGDLERTDRLPVLESVLTDSDVEDDAVRMDTSSTANMALPKAVDLPALAESVRSVEERIALQQAEYQALQESYDISRSAEAAAVERAGVLAAELGALRAHLDIEQLRARDLGQALEDRNAAGQAARAQIESSLRDVERHQGEVAAMRAALDTRDAKIGDVLHSLAERDAQLNALQREHAKIVPALEARSKNGEQLAADLAAARGRNDAMTEELRKTQDTVTSLVAKLKRAEAELGATRQELGTIQARAAGYLERLSTREWRRGFDQDLQNDADARAGAGRAADAAELKRTQELLTAAEAKYARLAVGMDELRQQAATRETDIAAALAQLEVARQPTLAIEAELKRLTLDLAAKTADLELLSEENRGLRATLERTRSALEEREFLIRRLERSESNNANALGQLQTSIERLGVGLPTGTSSVPPMEIEAQFVRFDGNHATSHVLSRRTRVGRAPGCELQFDLSSVSRHHALVLVGPREVIVEDLNSTNGVIVNGRKTARQLLNDGDVVMIGELQFRLSIKARPRSGDASANEPVGTASAVKEPPADESLGHGAG